MNDDLLLHVEGNFGYVMRRIVQSMLRDLQIGAMFSGAQCMRSYSRSRWPAQFFVLAFSPSEIGSISYTDRITWQTGQDGLGAMLFLSSLFELVLIALSCLWYLMQVLVHQINRSTTKKMNPSPDDTQIQLPKSSNLAI
jgi:hypothetical protein